MNLYGDAEATVDGTAVKVRVLTDRFGTWVDLTYSVDALDITIRMSDIGWLYMCEGVQEKLAEERSRR